MDATNSELTKEQKAYIESFDLWLRMEDNSNKITQSNIENACKMVELNSKEIELQSERYSFDVKRQQNAIAEYNEWCGLNGLNSYKK
jgi:hypothetical protein